MRPRFKRFGAGIALAIPALLLLNSSVAIAQPDTLWTNGTLQGGPQLRLIRTLDGGFAAGSAGFSGQNEHFNDLCLIKLDSLGNLEWQTFYPGTPEGRHVGDAGWSIQQFPDEGYVITGSSSAYGFIVRTDSRGDLIWQRYLSTEDGYFIVVDCVITEDEGVIGVGDGFIVKLDRGGEIVWTILLRDEHYIRCWGACNTSDDGVLATGERRSDVAAIKLDSDGNVEWEQRYGSEEFAEACAGVIQTTDGGYCYYSGSRDGNGSLGIFPYVVKTDSEGEVEWESIYDDRRGVYPLDLVETADGGFALVGYDRIPTGYSLLRVGFDGEFYWQATFERGSNGNSVLLMEDGGYLVGGFGRDYGCYLVRTEPDPVVIPFELSSSPSHDFGEVFVDSVAYYELVVTNSGRRYADILRAEISLGSEVFAVEFGELPRLFPGDSATLSIVFQPDSAIVYEGVLSVFFGADTVADTLEIALTGRGIPNVGVYDSAVNPPQLTMLLEVSPNPFNSTVTISYASGPAAQPTRLAIYDVNGRKVADLLSGRMPDLRARTGDLSCRSGYEDIPPGFGETGIRKEVTGRNAYPPQSKIQNPNSKITWDAHRLSSGEYIIILQTASQSLSRKVILIR